MAAARMTLAPGRARTTKPDQRDGGDGACTRRSTARRRSGPRTAGEHDRDVGAGHCGEVRQARAAEVLLQHRVHLPGVPDGEAREKARRSGLQNALRRVTQPLPQRSGRPLHSARLADGRGRSPGGDHRDDVVPPLRTARDRRGRGPAGPEAREPTRRPARRAAPRLGAGGWWARRRGGSRWHPRRRAVAPPPATWGSPSSARTTDAVRPASATARRGEPSRAAPRTAAVAEATATPASTVRMGRSPAAGDGARGPRPRTRPARPSRAGTVPRAAPAGSSATPRRPPAPAGDPPSLQRANGVLTPSPIPRAPRRSPGRCPARRRVPRRSGTAPGGCGTPRSAAPARGRCPATHPVPRLRPC